MYIKIYYKIYINVQSHSLRAEISYYNINNNINKVYLYITLYLYILQYYMLHYFSKN